MTGETPLTTDHRGVVYDHLCLFIRMAAEAETIPCIDKQGRALRVMRVVAGDALSTFKRLVFDISTRLQLRRVMAVVTKLASRFGGLKGLLGRGRLVAGIALHGSQRFMSARLQKLCLQRGMRIVTTRTLGFFHGITAMGLFK